MILDGQCASTAIFKILRFDSYALDFTAPMLWSPFSCAREARAAFGARKKKGTITWAQILRFARETGTARAILRSDDGRLCQLYNRYLTCLLLSARLLICSFACSLVRSFDAALRATAHARMVKVI